MIFQSYMRLSSSNSEAFKADLDPQISYTDVAKPEVGGAILSTAVLRFAPEI